MNCLNDKLTDSERAAFLEFRGNVAKQIRDEEIKKTCLTELGMASPSKITTYNPYKQAREQNKRGKNKNKRGKN